MTYTISGDGTGVTYGVYEGKFPNPKLIKSGLKSFKEAQKYIEELKAKKK